MVDSIREPPTDAGPRPGTRIEVSDVDGRVQEIPLDDQAVVIGRSEEAGIRLNCETVSRRHAEVFSDPFGRWWVRDLGSSNGTRVNGREVSEKLISSADSLEIGQFHLRLISEGHGEVFDSTPAAGPSTIPMDANPLRVGDEQGTHIATLGEVAVPKIDTNHLATLNEFANRISQIEDAQTRLGLLCELMVSNDFHGRSAVAIRLSKTDPEEPPHQLSQPYSAGGGPGQVPYLSRSLIRVVRRTETPALAARASTDPGAVVMTMISGHEDLAAVACPLTSTDEALDVLYVTLPTDFGTGEWLTLIAHAARTYEQIENALEAQRLLEARAAIERELARASEIQTQLVPETTQAEGIEIAIGFKPCRWVGGDYVDVLPIGGGRTILAIADVCGKGLPAAMVASTVHSMVHTCERAGIELKEMMRVLNEHLCQYTKEESFVTMATMVVNAADGSFEIVNAGHPAPIVVSPEGEIRNLQMCAHFPLGVAPFEVEAQTGVIPEGHLMAMFTDGLTELTDDDDRELGSDRIAEHLRDLFTASPDGPLEAVADSLQAILDGYQGRRLPQDDRTFLLACRRGGVAR